MRIEKIQLNGFKSFADKTEITLHPGVTCIVGPNGCGKSNIVDSFRWVLGEQRPRSLRGGKMEDVIFAGSTGKKPKGMAEVTLLVNGLGAPENGSDSLTNVTRRLFRSGESEYILNKNQCRLKDVRDIFLDTGLEVKSFSILEQDKIAAILNAKPEERRFLIEEVAGVVKYKVRREEAETKLDHSRLNLQRTSDVISEIKRQINSLDRQVKKAERYKRLTAELGVIELRVAKRELDSLKERLKEIVSEYESLKAEETSERAGLTREESALETGRIGTAEKERALNELLTELRELERAYSEAERAAAVAKAEREHLMEAMTRYAADIENNKLRRADTQKRIQDTDQLRSSIDAESIKLSTGLEAATGELKQSESAIAAREAEMEAVRKEAARVNDTASELKNEYNRYMVHSESLDAKIESIDAESSSLNEQAKTLNAALEEINGLIKSGIDKLSKARTDEAGARAALLAERSRLESIKSAMSALREELASLSSRESSLKELVFAAPAVDELKRAGIELKGFVSDAIEAEKQYESAIESGLGEYVNAFVVNSYDDIRRAVTVLSEGGHGRSALIASHGRFEPPRKSAADAIFFNSTSGASGVIGDASKFVRASDADKAMIESLLSGVVIVESLDAAMGLREKAAANNITMVAVTGERIEPSGVVTAGKDKGILPLKRQLREMAAEIENGKTKLSGLESDAASSISAISTLEENLKGIENQAVEIDKSIAADKHRADKTTGELERAKARIAQLDYDSKEAAHERSTLKEMMSRIEGEIKNYDEGRAGAETKLESMRQEIAQMRTRHEERKAAAVELRIALNSAKDKLNSLVKETSDLERLLSDLDRSDTAINQSRAQTESRIKEREAESSSAEETMRALAVRTDEKRRTIDAARSAIAGENEEHRLKERAIKTHRMRIDEIMGRIAELEAAKAENTMRIENLLVNIKNAYDVELGSYESAGGVTEEDESRMAELKEAIEKLGPVSLGSLEEYEELKGRYEFYTGQHEDITKSIAELEEAISRINGKTRKLLRDAYDALKVKFTEVFIRLFGGGRAELVLTDENNILETGIDIVAQPPGKKIQNITSLSGGEKTLTALSLLFASFLIKPSPLCILDEADAALDESNTLKFSQMLRELSSGIQFIVVTHNRVTMEAADYIYGVTMEEPGSSKTISMELAEAQAT